MTYTSPHRNQIAAVLRRADCHFGHTLRELEDELTVDAAAAKRGISRDQVAACRRAVHRVLDGQVSANANQASYDDAVLRALLHFDSEMTSELRRYVYARLAQVQSAFGLRETTQPLRCVTRGAQARRR